MPSKPTPPSPKKSRGIQYWTSQWLDANKRRRSKTFGRCDQVSEAHAHQRYRVWLVDFYNSERIQSPTKQATILELCIKYFEHCREYYRDPSGKMTSQGAVIDAALRPFVEDYGHNPADNMRATALLEYRESLIKRDLARTTINSYISAIKLFFKWAKTRELVAPGAYDRIRDVEELSEGRTRAKETKKVEAVTWDRIEPVLDVLPGVLQAMVQLQWWTAMRPGEVCIMRPVDVDVTSTPWVYEPTQHKTRHKDKDRRVFLGPRARSVLEPYLEDLEIHAFCFTPAKAMQQRNDMRIEGYEPHGADYRNWVSYQKRRKGRMGRWDLADHYTAASYRQAIGRACDAVFDTDGERRKVKDYAHRWTPNQIRHAAKNRMQREHGLEATRILMGHASVMTTQVYGDRDWKQAASAAQQAG